VKLEGEGEKGEEEKDEEEEDEELLSLKTLPNSTRKVSISSSVWPTIIIHIYGDIRILGFLDKHTTL
jgi:hypothetical protein